MSVTANRYTHSCAGMRTHRELQTMTTTERKTISESTANDKATCVVTLDKQITRYARRIAAQVCGGFADDSTVGGLVDALIIQEAVRRRLTDNDVMEDNVFSATVENREKLRKRDLNAGAHGKKVIE